MVNGRTSGAILPRWRRFAIVAPHFVVRRKTLIAPMLCPQAPVKLLWRDNTQPYCGNMATDPTIVRTAVRAAEQARRAHPLRRRPNVRP